MRACEFDEWSLGREKARERAQELLKETARVGALVPLKETV